MEIIHSLVESQIKSRDHVFWGTSANKTWCEVPQRFHDETCNIGQKQIQIELNSKHQGSHPPLKMLRESFCGMGDPCFGIPAIRRHGLSQNRGVKRRSNSRSRNATLQFEHRSAKSTYIPPFRHSIPTRFCGACPREFFFTFDPRVLREALLTN